MEYGHRTLQAVEQIYSTQFTKILINNKLTKPIPTYKGTRQGCPLYPLLFILSLQVLLLQIWNHPSIRGLKIKGIHYKLQAFADDLMIILEEPFNSILSHCELLESHGQVSGLKILKNIYINQKHDR